MKVRSFEVRLYPTNAQASRLEEILGLHCWLWNAALQQRIEAWKRRRTGRSLYDQQKELTILRAENPEFKELDAQSLGMTLSRLDLAFQAFFRRVKAGQAPGFPRFRSRDRFDSFTLRQNGWKCVNGILKLSGLGVVSSKGSAHLTGDFKTCTIKRKAGKWYAFIAVETGTAPTRVHGTATTAFDWGLENFLTLGVLEPGSASPQISTVENPFYFQKSAEKLAVAQQVLSRKKKGSRRRKKARHKVAKVYEKIANQRKDFLHKQSAALVAQSAVIITEELNVSKMSQSDATSRNRQILDSAPRMFLQMVRYKAEDAGIEFVELNTRKLKPSQTCWRCGRQEKKLLTQRQHECPCGASAPRDEATVRFMLGTYLGARDWPARGVSMTPFAETR